MDTAQRLKEVFAEKPGANELLERLYALPKDDQLMIFYFTFGSFKATTYEEWANFHGIVSRAIDEQEASHKRIAQRLEADKAAAQTTP